MTFHLSRTFHFSRTFRTCSRLLVGIVVAALASTRVDGWGTVGHRAVASIAQSQLSPQGQAGVKALLGTLQLADISICPDEVRTHERQSSFALSPACLQVFPAPQPTGTANWHFVDLDVTAPDPQDAAMDAFCKNDCVVAKILTFQHTLADKTAPPAARAQALSFLVHFVGDLHQPLHAAQRHNDRGGNLMMVTIPATSGATSSAVRDNLHSAWDTVFVTMIAGNEAALVSKLGPQIAAAKTEPVPAEARVSAWVHDWARQSEDLARTVAYRDNGKELDPNGTPTVSAAYEMAAMETISNQLAKAGFRLATLINLAFK